MRSGDLLYRLTRPIAYPWAKLAEASGDLVVRLVPMAGAGAAGAYLLTGALPLSLATAACLVVVGLLAAFVALTFQLAIGLGAFWIHDCRPLYWIWQKGTFLLGGLLIPLELYPGWLRTIAEVSPFAAILHGPGHLAFDGSLVAAGLVVLELLGWLVVALFVVHMLYRRGLRRIDGAGGG
jgi:ABC-2 type transport system permease protein